MSDKLKCSECGAPLAADVPGRLCLRCLLGLGLKREGVSESDQAPPGPAGADSFPGYQVFEKIGEGGCGIVYRASQLQPLRREVAIKVVKLGMDTRSVITRFEAERQALALMDHPNIARVYDAGVTGNGRPFFVMELVSGERITNYCDRKQLSIPQRLELFLQVCHAVQHAHQKGIIHRDLKPSNIPVMEQDGKPAPKVIDFGVAKAIGQQRLANQTVYTVFDQFVGTPAYMSPEQAGLTGEDIDTRSDIYSLGVLLYELLTGRPPFDPERLRRSALVEVTRIIREEEPLIPSARLAALDEAQLAETAKRRSVQANRLVSELRGDLDWLVMKALEKDRDRRYNAANGLAADIVLHLDNEPISARPPGAFYRLQKFTKRNRAVVAAIAAVSIALVVGTVVSTAEALLARRAETQARRDAAKSAQVQKFLERMIIYAQPGAYPQQQDVNVLKSIMDRMAREAKSEFTNEPAVLAGVLFSLGQTYDVMHEHALALNIYRDAADKAGKIEPTDYNFQALILEKIALDIGHFKGGQDATVDVAHQALALRYLTKTNTPVDIASSMCFQILAGVPQERGQLDKAKKLLREYLDACIKKRGLTRSAADAMSVYASVLMSRDEIDEAEAMLHRSLAIHLGSNDPPSIDALSRVYCQLGSLLRLRGRLDQAEKMYLAANDNIQRVGQNGYSDAILQLASLAELRHQTNLAEQYYRTSLDMLGTDAQPQKPDRRIYTLGCYATLRRHNGDAAGADQLLERACAIARENKIEPRTELLIGMVASARSSLTAGNATHAAAVLDTAMEMSRTVHSSRRDFILGPFLIEAAKLQLQAGLTNAAQQLRKQFGDALNKRLAAEEKSGDEPSYLTVRQLYQDASLALVFHDPASAEERYRKAIQISRRLTYLNSDIKAAYTNYAAFLKTNKRPAESAATLEELNKRTAALAHH